MKKKRVITFAAIAIFALLGIVATQTFWMRDALELREEQFDQRVKVALKSVSNQVLDAQIDTASNYLMNPCDSLFFVEKPVEELIDPELLDSLLNFEFVCMDLGKEYQYGVFNNNDSAFILGPYVNFEQDILGSEHRVSLTCIYKEDVYFLGVYFPNKKNMLFNGMIFLTILSLLFLAILLGSFYMIIRLMFRQKRLSQIKTDFINNMTHEFKTPIATISISSEMLLKPEVNKFPYKTKRYASVIFDENARLQKQVEQVLQLSVLEKGKFNLKIREVDLHRLIRKMAEHFSATAASKGGMIQTELEAKHYKLKADKTHLSNVIANLLDNALKYTPEKPDIHIKTRNHHKHFILAVSDNGIGISHEDQKHIFKKLYRVPTGNIHDVKGFGLGLYYVKTLVEAHGGTIRLKSELNKGTTIIIELPL